MWNGMRSANGNCMQALEEGENMLKKQDHFGRFKQIISRHQVKMNAFPHISLELCLCLLMYKFPIIPTIVNSIILLWKKS